MATVQKSQPAAPKNDNRSSAPAAKPSTVGALPTDKVAQRAYEIWLASGRPNGKDQEHWFQAERELRGTQTSRSTSSR
jgi:hypothetical protein